MSHRDQWRVEPIGQEKSMKLIASRDEMAMSTNYGCVKDLLNYAGEALAGIVETAEKQKELESSRGTEM